MEDSLREVDLCGDWQVPRNMETYSQAVGRSIRGQVSSSTPLSISSNTGIALTSRATAPSSVNRTISSSGEAVVRNQSPPVNIARTPITAPSLVQRTASPLRQPVTAPPLPAATETRTPATAPPLPSGASSGTPSGGGGGGGGGTGVGSACGFLRNLTPRPCVMSVSPREFVHVVFGVGKCGSACECATDAKPEKFAIEITGRAAPSPNIQR